MPEGLKIVKFSTPHWKKIKYGDIRQTPGLNGVWGNYKFEINNDCDVCDYWIIYESTEIREKVKVPKGNVILVTSEEVEQRAYLPSYLKQFDKILTSRDDLNGSHVIKDHYINAWFVEKNYDELLNSSPSKSKWLSVIASDLTILPGHKKRFAFINKLMGHFKDKIDVFGRGHAPLADKWDGLAPYRFSIAIENAQINDYFTEKLHDCFLSETCPIYMGCPNIEDYFDPKSFVSLNIDNFKESIEIIESTFDPMEYEKRQKHIQESKLKVLNELQFFPYMTRVLNQHKDRFNTIAGGAKTIHPKSYYTKSMQFKDSIYRTKEAFGLFLSSRISNE